MVDWGLAEMYRKSDGQLYKAKRQADEAFDGTVEFGVYFDCVASYSILESQY